MSVFFRPNADNNYDAVNNYLALARHVEPKVITCSNAATADDDGLLPRHVVVQNSNLDHIDKYQQSFKRSNIFNGQALGHKQHME